MQHQVKFNQDYYYHSGSPPSPEKQEYTVADFKFMDDILVFSDNKEHDEVVTPIHTSTVSAAVTDTYYSYGGSGPGIFDERICGSVSDTGVSDFAEQAHLECVSTIEHGFYSSEQLTSGIEIPMPQSADQNYFSTAEAAATDEPSIIPEALVLGQDLGKLPSPELFINSSSTTELSSSNFFDAALSQHSPAKKRKKEPVVDGPKCQHCQTNRTTQWRAGPCGPKTLCNACGIRFKSGRLVPEYRPAASPTFVASEHSSSHKKVLELRRQKNIHDPPVLPVISRDVSLDSAAAGETMAAALAGNWFPFPNRTSFNSLPALP